MCFDLKKKKRWSRGCSAAGCPTGLAWGGFQSRPGWSLDLQLAPSWHRTSHCTLGSSWLLYWTWLLQHVFFLSDCHNVWLSNCQTDWLFDRMLHCKIVRLVGCLIIKIPDWMTVLLSWLSIFLIVILSDCWTVRMSDCNTGQTVSVRLSDPLNARKKLSDYGAVRLSNSPRLWDFQTVILSDYWIVRLWSCQTVQYF